MSAEHTSPLPVANGGQVWAQRTGSGVWIHVSKQFREVMTSQVAEGTQLDVAIQLSHSTARELGMFMVNRTDDHRCYYADRSGGFGWPSCVICGKPASIETAHMALRVCCQTRTDTPHTPTCQSTDARRKRGQQP